jgi:hypothetical protein
VSEAAVYLIAAEIVIVVAAVAAVAVPKISFALPRRDYSSTTASTAAAASAVVRSDSLTYYGNAAGRVQAEHCTDRFPAAGIYDNVDSESVSSEQAVAKRAKLTATSTATTADDSTASATVLDDPAESNISNVCTLHDKGTASDCSAVMRQM